MIDPKSPSDEVKKWITRLLRTMKAAPPGIWLFNNGEMYIMADGDDGPVFTSCGGGVDQEYVIDSIPASVILSEGGDW